MNFADRFYPVAEPADFTGSHPDSAIARGARAAAKRGGKWLIDSAAIDTWLLTPGERRDVADALLLAEWGAALDEPRVLLLDLALATDELLLWAFA